MIDWRTWVFATLSADAALGAVVAPASMYGAGGLDARPAVVPFLVVRFGNDVPGPVPTVIQTDCQVWVHDDPGDYLLITEALGLVKAALLAVTSPGLPIRWAGDSPDLVDPEYNTATRNSSFVLSGKE